MDSITPDDFKVTDTIKLSKIPTQLNITASDDEKKRSY